MKLTKSTIIPALCWTARLAASSSAHIYIHDPQSQPRTDSSTLEPVPARLVLAQRAGVEDYHDSDLARKQVVDAINDYGHKSHLFDADDSAKRAFILLEVESDAATTMSSLQSYTSFKLDPAPDITATRGLFVDLAKQAEPALYNDYNDDDLYRLLKDDTSRSSHNVFRVAESSSNFETMLKKLEDDKFSITALITPREQTAASKSKFQWGTYSMPGAHASLLKRQRRIAEEPLTLLHPFDPVKSSSSEFSAPVTALANNTSPLRGILPACFTTQAACESATRKCTGHGSCSRKYHDSTATRDGVDCFSCSCQATKSSDGKKTTYWGGPACQKKDVSIQFWLIVLFSVGMIFLIGFAVGTIWDMGQQELPSVIGAGVSGPSARK